MLTPHTLCIWVNSLSLAPLRFVFFCGCEDQTILCYSWAHLFDLPRLRNCKNHHTFHHCEFLQRSIDDICNYSSTAWGHPHPNIRCLICATLNKKCIVFLKKIIIYTLYTQFKIYFLFRVTYNSSGCRIMLHTVFQLSFHSYTKVKKITVWFILLHSSVCLHNL